MLAGGVDALRDAVLLLDGVADRLTATDGGGLRTAAVTLAKLVGFAAAATAPLRRVSGKSANASKAGGAS